MKTVTIEQVKIGAWVILDDGLIQTVNNQRYFPTLEEAEIAAIRNNMEILR